MKQEPSCTANRNVKLCSHRGKDDGSPSKDITHSYHMTQQFPSRHIPKRTENGNMRRDDTPTLQQRHSQQPAEEAIQMSVDRELDNVVQAQEGILICLKREGNSC